MKRTASGLRAGTLTAVTLLLVAGCGGSDAGSDPSGSPTGTGRPEVTEDVAVELTQDVSGTTLSAAGRGDGEQFLLLPVSEPERSRSEDGITLTYLRGESDISGDEPELYEAARVPAGGTTQLDRPSFVKTPVSVQYCLEVVPPDEVAADAGGGTFRVHGREPGATPVVACSAMTKIRTTP